ncbi:nuclear transport factor 2 family protein [Streptomyces sp. NPDC007901]|uniref:nuclear transport factor 2 family protein n=1 Tax=Streptomyces sp. NPDC007901 TaxID=3364785 RepID=UPI0036F0DED5
MTTSPVTALLAIIDDERWEDLPTVLAEDCVIERPGAAPLTGLARIEQFYRHERPVAQGLHKIERIVAEGEAAACWGTFTGTGRDGSAIVARFADTFLLEAGSIRHRTTYLHGPAH